MSAQSEPDRPTDTPDTPDTPDAPNPTDPIPVTLRRAPRYGPFTVTGAAFGVLIGLVLALVGPASQGQVDGRTVLGYFCAIGLLLGGVAGAGLAVLSERRR